MERDQAIQRLLKLVPTAISLANKVDKLWPEIEAVDERSKGAKVSVRDAAAHLDEAIHHLRCALEDLAASAKGSA